MHEYLGFNSIVIELTVEYYGYNKCSQKQDAQQNYCYLHCLEVKGEGSA